MKNLPVDVPLVVLLLGSAGMLYLFFNLYFGVPINTYGQAVVTIAICIASALIGCELQRYIWYDRYYDELEQ